MELKTFDDFLKKYEGQTFRYWIYKKPGLSYGAFGDADNNSPLVNECADYGRIVEAYVMPDGDVMLGFINDSGYVEYQKLSDIDLAWSRRDQEDKND